MKCTMIFVLFAAVLVAVCALPSPYRVRVPPHTGGNPLFPGCYGSFNHRGRRSPYTGKVTVDQPIGRDPSVQVDVNQKVSDGPNGHIEIYGSASKTPNSDSRAEAGIRGQIIFDSEGLTQDNIDDLRKKAGIW